MNACRSAPSAVRNRAVILEALDDLMAPDAEVLEIGSGTGEHAVYFAAAMPAVNWHTSDLAEHHPSINGWISESQLRNVRRPIELDVRDSGQWQRQVDIIYTANTAHIMSADAVVDMFALAGRVLRAQGSLIVYGPFRVAGQFTTASNERFDANLRSSHADMGIRDLEWVDRLASANGLQRRAWMAMPSNNFILAWEKRLA